MILFLDGHASRWSAAAYEYFKANKIFVMCVPSHTTIWSQPNDAGANASIQGCMGRVLRESDEAVEAAQGGFKFNQLFRATFIQWSQEMANDLLSPARTNAIKDAWRKVGLGGRLNPSCDMWTAAISTFGAKSMLNASLAAIRLAISEANASAAAHAARGAAGSAAGADAVGDGADGDAVGGGADAVGDCAVDGDGAVDGAGADGETQARAEAREKAPQLPRVPGLSPEEALTQEQSERLRTALLGLLQPNQPSVDLCANDGLGNKTVVASACKRGTRVLVMPADEERAMVTVTQAQLEDPADATVQRLCDQYRMSLDGSPCASAKALAKARALEQKRRREAAAAEGKRRYDAKLEELRLWVEEQVDNSGEVHATPPPFS